MINISCMVRILWDQTDCIAKKIFWSSETVCKVLYPFKTYNPDPLLFTKFLSHFAQIQDNFNQSNGVIHF